jgi:prepilin-type N-terminal cleavage/methylation domain-containing protein/prepilin-type processing-associated H-X9-DG protein
MHRRAQGFSLIELLVVMTLSLLAYVYLYGPSSAMGQNRRKAECAQQLQQMHASLTLFAAEHNGAYPAVVGAKSSEQPLSLLVPLYTTDTSIFICPGTGDRALPGAQPFADRRCSYAYVMGLNVQTSPATPLASDPQVNPSAKEVGAPLFSSTGKKPGANHRGFGGSVLFVDGHVETSGRANARAFSFPTSAVLLDPKP